MEEGLKKRLVGAGVLASLAVIFVPMLIDDPSVSHPELSEIPPAPQVQPFASSMISEPVPRPEPVPVDLTGQTAPKPAPAKVPTAVPASATPDPRPQTGLSAWAIKVGSFSSQESAAKLVSKLRKAGFQTQAPEQIERGGKTLYRVRVGPMVDKAKARQLLPKVNKVSGTKGQVSRYP